MPENAPFEQFCILELMGHVRLAGKITEENRFGVCMGRIDVPLADGKWQTVYFGGQSVYKCTPCDEATARAVAVHTAPAPISRFELPQLVHEDRAVYSDPDPRREEDDPEDEDRDDDNDW